MAPEVRLMVKKRYFFTFIALVAVVIACLSLSEDKVLILHQKAFSLSGPFLQTVDRIKRFFNEIDTGLQNRQSAQEEVQSLRTENSRLAMENTSLRKLEQENARLREMLAFKQESTFKLLPCRVISRDASSWWNTVQINRGWFDDKNLDKDLPVVNPRGLVGKTGVVSRYTTDVILLIDENCKVAAVTRGSNAQGIVTGEGNFDRGKPRMRMEYIDRNAAISVGELVYTSGLGGVFPAGLPIGVVTELSALKGENFGLYQEAIIEPIADMGQLKELFIIEGSKE